uniref:CH-like domain-containing protein n=1 Tax=Strigamia maritima TaxID=126957 RepID=T1J5Q2_STRMM
MAGIICKWLNYEVKLSKIIGKKLSYNYGTLGQDFSNGYFFAQIFWRYEPLWDQLEIKTTDDIIADMQNAKTSTIIEQLYKMFVSIENQKCHIKQPAGTAREFIIRQDRLVESQRTSTQLIKLQNAAIKEIEQSISDSVEACWRLQDMMTTREMQLNVKLMERQEKTKKLLEGRSQRISDRLKEFIAVPNEISKMEETKNTSYIKVKDYIADRRLTKKKKEAKTTYADIDEFEQKNKLPPLYKKPVAEDVCLLLKPRLLKAQAMQMEHPTQNVEMADVNFKWNQDYVDRIRLQLHEELKLRLVRKQRKHQAVEEQLQLFQGTEREQIEEIMVEILLRQSKFEKKLINELMLIRKEKAVILESRRLHAKQLAVMREREFANALDLEQRRSELDKTYRNAQIASDWQFHKLLLAKHTEQCQKKHYEICSEIVSQIVDMTTCVAHHLILIGNKIPPRLWREWKVLFIQGKPFYSHIEDPTQLDEPWELAVEDIQKEEERLNAMDEAEFLDFKVMYVFPPPQRMPEFPLAPFTLCVLGKPFIGKSSTCDEIVNAMSPMPIKIINTLNALEEALLAYHDVEDILSPRNYDEYSGEGGSDCFEPLLSSSMSLTLQDSTQTTSTSFKTESIESSFKPESINFSDENPDADGSEYTVSELTPLAVLGYLAWNTMKQGNEVDDNIMVKIILEIVRQLPNGTSWILDGFPINLAQAKFLETGMSAYYTPEDLYILHSSQDKEPNIYQLRSSHLLSNPDPPEPPIIPKCSIDLVVYLDADDDYVLSRASNHIASNEIDLDLSQVSVHERLKKFNEDWAEVKNWFESMTDTLLHILKLDVDCSTETVTAITGWINDILSKNDKPKEPKLLVSNRSESTRETYYFSQGINDKSFQFPTPTVSLLDTNMIRLAAGEELLGDPPFTIPKFSDTEISFNSGNSSEESSLGINSALGSVISSLVLSLSDLRPSQPGDVNWEFIAEQIPFEIASNIARTWQNMEMGYIEIIKRSFRKIRQYQDSIIQTFFNLQQDFKQFLQRPDTKQDFVSRWQDEYNSLDADMRSDEETKSELHMRVDDLRHLLWEISDQRLQESKIELSQIASCGWLDDWLILMSNRYICVLQAEVDRFYDTIQIISDFYDAAEGVPLKELSPECGCKLPLMDMSIESDSDSALSIQTNFNTVQSSTGNKGKSEDDDCTGLDDYGDSLMHRTFVIALGGIEKVHTLGGNGVDHYTRLSLLYQGFRNGNEIKENRVKGIHDEILAHVSPDIANAGIKQLIEPKEKINLEYYAAIAEEECRVKTNLWLIEHVGMFKIGEFNKHSSSVYGHLERVLATKYQKELDAIEDLCRAMGYAIEQEIPLQDELVLNDDLFFINADVILFPTPAVELKVSSEEVGEEGFTVVQLLELCKQFLAIAPTGFIPTHQLENIFNDIIAKDNNFEIIPDEWVCLKPYHIHKLMDYISGGQEFINWRLFLLYLSKPWPQPNETQLIETLDSFHAIDVDNRGTINKLQYDKQVELWFKLDRSLLNHFTADDDPFVGFTNALALACGYPILSDVKDGSKYAMHVYTCKTDKFQTLQNILHQRPKMADAQTNSCSSIAMDIRSSEECPVPFSVAFQYAQPIYKESNRMDVTNAEKLLEELENIFLELGSFDCEPVPYLKLMDSSKLRKKIVETSFFKELDIYYYVHELLQSSAEDTFSFDDDVKSVTL